MLGAMLHTLLLLLAELGALLASGPDSQSSFLEIIFPEKIEDKTNSEEQISYVIPINKKKYTVHLQKRYFLTNRFMVYMYNQGSTSFHSSNIPAQCYYQGYIKGYPGSVATLSTCSGLRGFLQFENVSYGIEPLESAATSQHIVYELGKGEKELLFNKNSRNLEMPTNYGILINKKPKSPSKHLFSLYLEMTIVVDKALYDYLGSDSMIVTNKVIEIISLVNSVFEQFKVTIVLSSLELWSDKNKIPTVGEADELLRRFSEWKQSYLTLRPHDVAYLFIYNEQPNYMGATYPGKMCTAPYSAGITMYPKDMTLEAFSVILTQMLGLSLGISYDNPEKCHCSEKVCIMNPRAMQYTGVKTFSNCSSNDFERFKLNEGAKCLQNKPEMQRSPRAVCGNGKVEGDEICDCGSQQQCGANSCCEPTSCVLKSGKACDSMSPSATCCKDCQFLPDKHECRPSSNMYCDIAEVCNGSSGQCPPDIILSNGIICGEGGTVCYNGNCPNLDRACEAMYGLGSTNAPFACYEEIQGQNDRFGNCGKDQQNRYIFCGWRNLICGRLVCTYPSKLPFIPPNISTASVIYAFVRDKVCISVDFGSSVKEDPLRVLNGAVCDLDRICLNGVCVESRFLKAQSTSCAEAKCNGHGVCTSRGDCHCSEGFQPPSCTPKEGGDSSWYGRQGLPMEGASRNREKKWLLSLYIVLIILTTAVVLGTGWKGLKKCRFKEEESMSSESKSEDNTQTYNSRSKSEASSGSPTSS
ncbi:disintegrin and metalloproteinase domain-containing protein 32 precursor [Rattus norvegicus]|uniref:disintegrin and metalloproteinase domain-containing protein 32 precursor n=1 Tax=Rattus norvegicus TaxID=10116 RepID=UPI0001C06AE8|nr:disintegrin and metalloproteinase domain-containing protein 32 precursor [Rattus norvegicus]|eukprot:NP_001164053.1 disintegrin and metalloproteinase domain-containing protein 32 precursor [Rattus norvegicus]